MNTRTEPSDEIRDLLLEMTLEEPELDIAVPERFFEPLEKDGKKILPLEALFTQGSE